MIRQYKYDDARTLADIYYNTIHVINTRDYSKKQLDAWAPSSYLELEGWQKKWTKLSPIVASLKDEVVGFAEFEPNGHIDCFYVHHEFQSCGVGSALMNEIEKIAKQNMTSRIYAEVSITAKAFFERKGFKIVKEQTVVINDVELINFVMEKSSSKKSTTEHRRMPKCI